MKKTLTAICFSCFVILANGKSPTVYCGDDISVIQDKFQISFGDTISAGISSELSLPVSWNVHPKNGLNVSSGAGKTTGDLIFSQPGKYQITFSIPAHGDHPAKDEIVVVDVSPVKMFFDKENIRFSKELKTGSVSGIIVTVPVKIKTFDNRPIEYSSRTTNSTGVATISLNLMNTKKVLKDGYNELAFELDGVASNQGNVQFRIYDLDGRATFFNCSITK